MTHLVLAACYHVDLIVFADRGRVPWSLLVPTSLWGAIELYPRVAWETLAASAISGRGPDVTGGLMYTCRSRTVMCQVYRWWYRVELPSCPELQYRGIGTCSRVETKNCAVARGTRVCGCSNLFACATLARTFGH
jgi:hypothetical protein